MKRLCNPNSRLSNEFGYVVSEATKALEDRNTSSSIASSPSVDLLADSPSISDRPRSPATPFFTARHLLRTVVPPPFDLGFRNCRKGKWLDARWG